MAWIIITIVDQDMKPLEGVILNATSPQYGPWNGVTNCAGQFIPNLGPGHYDIKLSKSGYKEYTWPTELGDCGPITQALEYDVAPPDRDRIINVQGNFCNLFDDEDIPIWDIYLATLLVQGNDAKFNNWVAKLRTAGTTHVNIALSYNYNEPLGWGTGKYPIDGMDFTNRLTEFKSIVNKIRELGFIPIIKLALDGQGYDPNGWTYGWKWGIDNMPKILPQLWEFYHTSLWSTGFDGCFPNWTPEQTIQMLQLLREILGPDACIDTEFAGPGTVGYCHMGGGEGDWVPDKLGILDSFSVEVFTNPPDPTGVQQVASRMLYTKKNIEPANDYAGCYLNAAGGKKINVGMYETCAFQIIRKQITSLQAKQAAQITAHYGFQSFGNGLP